MSLSRKEKVNSLWSKLHDQFESEKLHSKTLNIPSEEAIESFISDFNGSDYSNKFTVKKHSTENKVTIRRNYNSFAPKFSDGGEILEEFKELSKVNNHTEAAILLAEYFNDKDAVEKLKTIQKDQDKRGYITQSEQEVRDEISNKYYYKLKGIKFENGRDILDKYIPEDELMEKLKGKYIKDYALGEDEPSYSQIESAYISDKKFLKRDVFIKTKRGDLFRFPLEKLPRFLNLEEITLKDDKFVHAIELSEFIKGIYKKLREVRVTYDDGTVIDTNVSATLSDDEIKKQFKVGSTVNIGSGEKDKLAKIQKVEILYATGGEINERVMKKGEAVLYDGKTHYIKEKNGVVGLVNLSKGAWGTDYPFTPLSRIIVSEEVTDMYGNKVQIPYTFEDGGDIENSNWNKENITEFLSSAGQDDSIVFVEGEDKRGRSKGDFGMVTFDVEFNTLYLKFENKKEAQMAFGKLSSSMGNPYEFSSRFDLMPDTIMVQIQAEDIYEDGGEISGELEVNEDLKHKALAKRFIEERKGKIPYKVAILLLQGERNPDDILKLEYDHYNRVLRTLDSIVSNKHEMSWRTNNYSQSEAENWARESVKEIFHLKNEIQPKVEKSEQKEEVTATSNMELSAYMFNKLIKSGHFKSHFNGTVHEVYHKDSPTVLGKYNPKTKSLFILSKVENNPLRDAFSGKKVKKEIAEGTGEKFYIWMKPRNKAFKAHLCKEYGAFETKKAAERKAKPMRKQKDIYTAVKVVSESELAKLKK